MAMRDAIGYSSGLDGNALDESRHHISHVPSEPAPAVLIPGFLAPDCECPWGPLDDVQNDLLRAARRRMSALDEPISRPSLSKRRRLIYVFPGQCSSVHDRACEVFYQLKGGRVDYGEQHSQEYGHDRYGRYYEGLYPQWDQDHPLHFVGHSLGGPTLYKLQELLAAGHLTYTRPNGSMARPNEHWILSLTGISAPFRGTTAVYLLGARPAPHVKGSVRVLSFGGILYRLLHLYQYFVPLYIQRHIYDLKVEHWGFGRRSSLLQCLIQSPWAEGTDNAPYDLTVQARWDDWEGGKEGRKKWKGVGTRTWYRTYATSMTSSSPLRQSTDVNSQPYHIPTFWPLVMTLLQAPWQFFKSFPLIVLALFVGHYNVSPFQSSHVTDASDIDSEKAKLATEHANAFRIHEWYENDGLVSKIAQYHPGTCEGCYSKQQRRRSLELDMEPFCYHRKGLQDDIWRCPVPQAQRSERQSPRASKPPSPDLGQYSLPSPPNSRSCSPTNHRFSQDMLEGIFWAEPQPCPVTYPEKPATWYVTELEGISHLDLCIWNGRRIQWEFWQDVFTYLAKVDYWWMELQHEL
ncbi:hypothetical protein BZG36_01016 [Bifiguratus adelaidae]|uniref:Lipase-like C-terminal domain-containing protein n=1 Tax=Bifiguratus adelaidae TaxID=1938954 RepID=A0A261Y6L3_9FUNG|nr:hypothetical protein BZG36_01016 [Bifiguratus adelaidae]